MGSRKRFYHGVARPLIILLGVIGIAGLQEGLAQTDCPGALQDYRVALKSYEDGLLDPAIASFTAYLQRCPGGKYTTQAHYLLGEISYRRQHFSEALQHAAVILSGTTDASLHPHAALLAGQSLVQLDQPEKALTYLQRIATPGAPAEVRQAALYWLGEIAFQRQRYDEARTHYQRLVSEQGIGPYTVQAYYSLGWLARQLGDAPAALEAFTTFLKLAPSHEFAPQVRFMRAELLRATHKLADAAKAFQLLAQNPDEPWRDEALFWWAEVVSQQGHLDEARALYERLVTEYPQSARVVASLYGWGWAAIQQHQCAEAVPPWERLLQHEPTFPQALTVQYQLGLCYVQLQQPARARSYLQQVVDRGESTPYFADALGRLATLTFALKEYSDAVRYATRALSVALPEDIPRLHYLLGETYAALGQSDAALEHWQLVGNGPPDVSLQAQALYRIGSEYVRQRAWEKAIPVLRQLWEHFSGFPERSTVAMQLAQAYSATQRCTEALALYDTLIEATPMVAEQRPARIAKAFCLLALDRYADIITTLSPLLAADSSIRLEARELYLLGQAHMQLHQYHAALEVLTLLYQRFPTAALTAAAEPSLALALEQAGRYSEALAVWRTYLQRPEGKAHQNLPQFQLRAGRLAFKEGNAGEALDYLAPVRETAIAAFAAEALFWSGEVYFQQQQWELAQQVYQELLDRYLAEQQWSTLARWRLGMLYEQRQEWEQALRAYRVLLTATTDADIIAHVRQRIGAIEAGRVPRTSVPSPRLSDG